MGSLCAQDVSGPADRVDQGASHRVELAAEPPHEDVDRVADRVEVVVPDMREDLAAVDHTIGMTEEVVEEGEFPRGELDPPAAAGDAPGGGVELEVVQAEDRREGVVGATCQGAQPGEE